MRFIKTCAPSKWPWRATDLPGGGLRERKKQQTRRSIAAVAARLFKKRGFENVRMIDIARIANVSEQTVYNYFPSKEHLIFDMDQEFEAMLVGIVRNREPGVSLGDSLCKAALDFLDKTSRSIGKDLGLPVSVVMGPALRRVWVEMNARFADSLTSVLIEEDGMRKPSAKILARAIVAVFSVILEEVGEASLEKRNRTTVRRELRLEIAAIVTAMMAYEKK